MRVLHVDPWGVNNLAYYTNSLCAALADRTESLLVTNSYYINTSGADYPIRRIFFRFSEPMRRGRLRKAIRAIEYVLAYIYIIMIARRERFDVVHIQWLLFNSFDRRMLPILRRYCSKLVLTAHNVTPHLEADASHADLRCIYGQADAILVHGAAIKRELLGVFPDVRDKIVVQRHGAYVGQPTSFTLVDIDPAIRAKVALSRNVYLFLGSVHADKGVDRVIRSWASSLGSRGDLLVVAGRVDRSSENRVFLDLEPSFARNHDVVYLPTYISDNLMAYLLSVSDLVLLPYRHASMSGVIFTAATFQKPVLATDVGAFSEYIIDGRTGILCENDDDAFMKTWMDVSGQVGKDELERMGKDLRTHIRATCDWRVIADKLIDEVYS